jgi:hypothetical protein
VSVAASAKAYLVGAEGVLVDLLAPVKVGYSLPRDVPREMVYGGTVVGTTQLSAFAGGGRVRRQEDLTLLLHVRVYKPGATTSETAEARALEIAKPISDYLAANWTLGGLAELKSASVAGVELDSWVDDDGAGTTLDLGISLMSYLT